MQFFFKQILPTVGIMLIVGLIGLYFGTQSAQASRTGPFTLVAHSNENANVGVFRIDNGSGAVSFCFLEGGNSNVTVRCTPSVE